MTRIKTKTEFIQEAIAKGHCLRSMRETCPCLAYRIKGICMAYEDALKNEQPKETEK